MSPTTSLFSSSFTESDACPFCGPVEIRIDHYSGRTLAVSASGATCSHTYEQRQEKLARDTFGEKFDVLRRTSTRGPRLPGISTTHGRNNIRPSRRTA